jgi:hypothetical protein
MNVRYLALDRADPVLQFANVIARSVDDVTNVAKMLKNDVVGLNHCLKLSKAACATQRPMVVAPHRVSFLYFTRCGMMLSCPSLRILSFS